MGIVNGKYKAPVYWTGKPRYKLKDCRCGATQNGHDVYTMFVGSNKGFWCVRCRSCGAIICGETQKEAVKNWNGGEAPVYE